MRWEHGHSFNLSFTVSTPLRRHSSLPFRNRFISPLTSRMENLTQSQLLAVLRNLPEGTVVIISPDT